MIKAETTTNTSKNRPSFGRTLPLLQQIATHSQTNWVDDLVAGMIVAIMLIPQGMAYAMLADLPPQIGLYACVLPLILYALFGSSRYLAVGPVAIVSLLTAASIHQFGNGDPARALTIAVALALLVGVMQVAMGLLKMGFLVNLLSHPVLTGFSSAAAILIGTSQLKTLFGISYPRTEGFVEEVTAVTRHLGGVDGATAALGLIALIILYLGKSHLPTWLKKSGVSAESSMMISRLGLLFVVVLTTIATWLGRASFFSSVKTVGTIPTGLPHFVGLTNEWELWQQLLPAALAITLVGYMESISVSKLLAGRRREKISPNQELFALGMANIGAAFTGAYPVTGGLSRSMVNYEAGARSTFASLFTAILIMVTLLFLTPLLYFVPQTTLAAIILIAIMNLFGWKTFLRVWHYSKHDAAALLATFFVVLLAGVENGILVGMGVSILLFIWRSSKPHIAIVGRLPNSETYLNVLRHPVQTWPTAVLIRLDASLYFANTEQLETVVLNAMADNPELRHVVLIGTAINQIDYSGLEMLESIWHEVASAGLELHFAGIKGPVMDRLKSAEFVSHIGCDHFHLTVSNAVKAIGLSECAVAQLN